jgi:hypothetical protein
VKLGQTLREEPVGFVSRRDDDVLGPNPPAIRVDFHVRFVRCNACHLGSAEYREVASHASRNESLSQHPGVDLTATIGPEGKWSLDVDYSIDGFFVESLARQARTAAGGALCAERFCVAPARRVVEAGPASKPDINLETLCDSADCADAVQSRAVSIDGAFTPQSLDQICERDIQLILEQSCGRRSRSVRGLAAINSDD